MGECDNTQLFFGGKNHIVLKQKNSLYPNGDEMCIVGDLLSLRTIRKAESDGTSIVIQA